MHLSNETGDPENENSGLDTTDTTKRGSFSEVLRDFARAVIGHDLIDQETVEATVELVGPFSEYAMTIFARCDASGQRYKLYIHKSSVVAMQFEKARLTARGDRIRFTQKVYKLADNSVTEFDNLDIDLQV